MTNARTSEIDFGDAGVMQTIDAMADMVVASIRLPIVVETARRIVARSRGQYAQAVALRVWLKRVWRFVDDPFNVELLIEPAKALSDSLQFYNGNIIIGDCDEAATMGAALGAAVGLRPSFQLLAYIDETGIDRLCHVYAAILTDDGRTVDFDITRPPSGVPAPTREITVSVF